MTLTDVSQARELLIEDWDLAVRIGRENLSPIWNSDTVSAILLALSRDSTFYIYPQTDDTLDRYITMVDRLLLRSY